MSLGPEQLEELHDEFMNEIRKSIPVGILDEAVGPGSVETDIVAAVKLLTRRYQRLQSQAEALRDATRCPADQPTVRWVSDLAEKAWMYDDLCR